MANFETIQIDYEQLDEIAKRFSSEADRINDLIRAIAVPLQQLQDGGWEGKGATAFFQEMDAEVLPVLNRLLEAFESGETLVKEISNHFQTAEEEAAAQIDFDVSTSGGSAGLGAGSERMAPSGDWVQQIPGAWAASGLQSIGFTPTERTDTGQLNGTISLPGGQQINAKLSVTEMKPLFEK